MNFWLMKSEPDGYSIDDLKRDKTEPWDGIRNYQVRNMIRDDIKKGDISLFYHSNAGKETGVVGVMKVIKNAYPDPTQFDLDSKYYDPKSSLDNPRWLCVDVRFVKKLSQTITLESLKSLEGLSDSALVKKGNRLSVIKINEEQFEEILASIN